MVIETTPPTVMLGSSTEPWLKLLTEHGAKGDFFSVKTIVVILEGVEKLAELRQARPELRLSNFHQQTFARLLKSFSNPELLKQAALMYLSEFELPAIALKHLELAQTFAPKDRDLEELRKTAAVAMAARITALPSYSGIDIPTVTRPPIAPDVIRKTTRLHSPEARQLSDQRRGLIEKLDLSRQTSRIQAYPIANVPKIMDPAPFLRAAREAVTQGDFPTAFAALEKATGARAASSALEACFSELGLAAYEQERLPEAYKAYEQARVLSGGTFESWFNCGIILQKSGDLDGALNCYLEAVDRYTENAKVWCSLATIYFHQVRNVEAESAARRSLALKPDYFRAWDILSSVLSAQNRLEEAAEACHQAIRLQPKVHDSWFKLGVIYFQQENFVAAEEALSSIAENEHYQAYAHYYLSMIAARKGDLDQAVAAFEQAQTCDPENDLGLLTLNELAQAFARFGRHAEASEYLQEVTRRTKDDFLAWLALGSSEHRAENYPAAEAAYERAAELEPESPLPWHNLGLLASDQNKSELACHRFQREVDLAPQEPKAWYDLGLSLERLGREEESREAIRQAEELVQSQARHTSDLSTALSIVRRLNLKERMLR